MRFLRHRERSTMPQASVRIHLVTSQLRRRHTGDVIPIQTENAPLIFLELRRLSPSHIVAPWEPDNHLVPFDLSSFEDGLNLQNGFMPVRIVFRNAIRGGRLGRIPPMNFCDPPNDHEVRRVQPVLQLLITLHGSK